MNLIKGMTLIHEHITIDLSGVKNNDDCNLNCFDQTVEEFKELYDYGVLNIIDVTADGMGRNIEYVNRVSELTGINIIQATGYYKEPFLPEYVYEMTERELADKMIQEIRFGIGGTNTKAGVIGEIGSSLDSFEPMEIKIFTAACIAAKETNAIISTHTTLSTMALQQAEFFLNHDMDPSKIIIGHQDLKCDGVQIRKLINMGFNVAFDTIGKNNYQPDENRVLLLKQLQDEGLLANVCLSLDITRKSNMKYLGGIGYTYIFTDFIPMMLGRGITQESIDLMLIHNPLKLFGGQL